MMICLMAILLRWMKAKMGNRITKQEATIYRYCHHDFEGLTVVETAATLGISESKVRRLLKSLESKAPQLFPILSRRDFNIYKLVIGKGLTQQEIADTFGWPQSTVQAAIQRMRDQGIAGLDVDGIGKTVNYESSMDSHIHQKF